MKLLTYTLQIRFDSTSQRDTPKIKKEEPQTTMASGNPTLDAANEATGVEPLNAGPNEPQIPQEPPAKDDNIPDSLRHLPAGYELVVFPLSLQEKTDSHQSVSSLPSARQLEDFVKAKISPSGPARAEEMTTGSWQDKYSDILVNIREAVDDGQVKFYRVETGLHKAEGYIVGLDLDGERMVGVRILGLDG